MTSLSVREEQYARRTADEQAMRANPPQTVHLTFHRYGPDKHANIYDAVPHARQKLTSVLLLPSPRESLPLTRIMLREHDPRLPNQWNFGKHIPHPMVGILIPISQHGLVKSEDDLLHKLKASISGIGVHPENIFLEVADAGTTRQLAIAPDLAQKMLVDFLIVEPVRHMPPSLPTEYSPFTVPPPAYEQKAYEQTPPRTRYMTDSMNSPYVPTPPTQGIPFAHSVPSLPIMPTPPEEGRIANVSKAQVQFACISLL